MNLKFYSARAKWRGACRLTLLGLVIFGLDDSLHRLDPGTSASTPSKVGKNCLDIILHSASMDSECTS
jgi:hypothetical protein